jgi:glycosyltransferase involved in cell wall biosynthesis
MTERRVLVLNHFAVPRGEPGGTRHVELFSRLDGWTYAIIASRLNLTTGRPQAAEPGFVPVPVLPYRNNGWSRIANWASYAVSATWAALRQPRPDVVYGSSPHLLAGLAAWFVARVRRATFVLEIRDLWPRVLVDMGQMEETSPVYRLLQGLERFLYRRADRIVAMATGTVDVLKGMGVPEEKIAYIPNGADPEDFVPSASRDELRKKYGFEGLTFVYAGAHGPANGLDLLLDAAACTNDEKIDVVLIGSGVEKERLMERAAAENIQRVRFLEAVPKTEMADVLAAADVGVHVLADVELFSYGVSPNKVFDYMAAGLPVLTNTPGVVADLVESAAAGISVKPHAIAEGLRRFGLLSVEERARLGQTGQQWIAYHQSRTAMATRLERTLTGMASDSPDLPSAARPTHESTGQ